MASIKDEIIEDLTTELKDEADFNADILAVKVKGAIYEVRMKRNYSATSYTESEIESDLFNFYSTILNLARYDYNQLGAEGEQSHTENGITRNYTSRDDILKGVHAFVKVL